MSVEKELLISDLKRRLCEESIPRIIKCLAQLNTNEVWWSENENSNSIANLILHLNGNVRQWIFSGLLGEKDHRDRKKEFNAENILEVTELKKLLCTLEEDLVKYIPLLHDVDLSIEKTIQGIQENGVSILIHVIEHFSYHTGQIALITKRLKNTDLGFYRNARLDDLNP